MKNKLASVFAAALLACGAPSNETGDKNLQVSDEQTKATLQVKGYIEGELGGMCSAAKALQAAAPTHAWDKTADAAAITTMKQQWSKTRVSYERIEGAIAVLFPELDFSTDARYEHFVETEADTNLFDAEGATGMHAIERVLWADETPEAVIAFEATLDHYVAAAYPASEEEANTFKTGLVQRLVDDCETMQSQFRSAALDASTAFRGVIGSMGEQHEKVLLAHSAREESRYAQHTLADMRANLEGGVKIYAAFKTWVRSKNEGAMLDKQIEAGFEELATTYSSAGSDALPPVPADFNPDAPTPAQLSTPYGRLFAKLTLESDAREPTSLVSQMEAAANALGIPQLPQ